MRHNAEGPSGAAWELHSLMHLAFYVSPKPRRLHFALDFAEGVRRHGDTVDFVPIGKMAEKKPDVTAVVGNKNRHNVLDDVPMLVFDKPYPTPDGKGGFTRGPHDHARVSVNTSHPVQFVTKLNMSNDRRHRFGWQLPEWRRHSDHVLVAGSSRVYYIYKGQEPVLSIQRLLNKVEEGTKRTVKLRLKPNMTEPEDRVPLTSDLRNCHVLVVENSMIAFEALLSGVPAIVLDDAPTAPISGSSLVNLEDPPLAPLPLRYELLNDLAYFQYSEHEYERGDAWEFLRTLLNREEAHAATK